MSEGERPSPEGDRPLPLGPREPTKENYTPAIQFEGQHYTGPYHTAARAAMASELNLSGDALRRAKTTSKLGFIIRGVFYDDRDACKIFKASVSPSVAKKLDGRDFLTSDDVD